MKHLVGITCTECGKKFFALNTEVEKDKKQKDQKNAQDNFCSNCLKVKGIDDQEVKDSIKDVLSLYKDSPGEGRYKIEDI